MYAGRNGTYQSPLKPLVTFFSPPYVKYATEERASFIPCCNLVKATASKAMQH